MESLLRSHDHAGSFLDRPAVNLKSADPDTDRRSERIGRRIGVYQIVEEVGRGGMGEVYRAVRADGQYDKQVAIKLVRVGWDTSMILERFRHERQILASLESPNIARLYDGGTTEDGLPYLVIELVEGVPIDRYCEERRLNIAKRLELFCQVCKAVQYAHQRLVIHRDIKPSNILVTADGVPKLLDFGIAKVLGPTSETESTQAVLMTPGYASPEQIRGDAITTATDTYALGVVLYRLLTGRSPYPESTHAPQQLARLICEAEPAAPSAVIRRDGRPTAGPRRQHDLDNIALKALRKEPDRRYTTAEQFADDIQRYLRGAAVTATPDSVSYRLRTFITRHTVGVVASVMIVAAVLTGVIATVREARIAAANEQRAERRFNDVRRLANSLIFELHDSIQDLPGATPARKLLVDRALQYLDSLAREATADASLQRDLASAYQRIGDVQGKPFAANLGDTAGALRSYHTARALREAIFAAHPNDIADGIALAQALRLHAAALSMSGSIEAAGNEVRRAVATSESIVRMHSGNSIALEELCLDYGDLAGILGGNLNSANLGDQTAALAAHESQLATARRLVALDPANRQFQSLEVVAELTMGDQLISVGRVREAATYFQNARDALTSQSSPATGRKSLERLHAIYMRIANVQLWSHDATGALASYRAGFELAGKLSAEDPNDAYARFNLASDYANLADALSQTGDLREARVDAAKAVEMVSAVVAADPTNSEYRVSYGVLVYIAGEVALRGRDSTDALRMFRRAVAIFEAIYSEDPKNVDARLHVAAALVKVADALAAGGDVGGAREAYRNALARLGGDEAAARTEEARYAAAGAYLGLGAIDAGAARRRDLSQAERREYLAAACDWYERSNQEWALVREPGAMSPNGFYAATPDFVRGELARCGPAPQRRGDQPYTAPNSWAATL